MVFNKTYTAVLCVVLSGENNKNLHDLFILA